MLLVTHTDVGGVNLYQEKLNKKSQYVNSGCFEHTNIFQRYGLYILMFDIVAIIKKKVGVRCSTTVECPLMVRWAVRSIPHGGPIEILLVPASGPQLVYQRLWYVGWCI